MLLSDDVCEQVLRFVAPDLASWKRFSVASRRCLAIAQSPVSWSGANIELPAAAMNDKNMEQVLNVAANWRLAKSLCLAAHPRRQSLATELQTLCPDLAISVAAQGPYSMFVMGCRCDVGDSMGLHFFEPRYRWMCRRMFEGPRPHMFAFVTSGGACPGSAGVLCEVTRFRSNADGTFDVNLVARSAFSILEAWPERVPELPRAPPLAVGLLDVDGHVEKSSGITEVLSEVLGAVGARSSHASTARRGILHGHLSRILGCIPLSFRCCPRRAVR